MSRRVEMLRPARLDLIEMAEFIALDSVQQADRLFVQTFATLDWIAQMPHAGMPWSHGRHKGLRYWHVRGFPNHMIVYRTLKRKVVIVRLLHTARHHVDLL